MRRLKTVSGLGAQIRRLKDGETLLKRVNSHSLFKAEEAGRVLYNCLVLILFINLFL